MKESWSKILNKEQSKNDSMSAPLFIGLILIGLFVIFLLPTVDVLTINVPIPPDQNSVNLIQTKITIWQQWNLNLTNATRGDIAVNIFLKSSQNVDKFKGTYLLMEGDWAINTYEPISRGDIVTVEILRYNFRKVMIID